MSTLSRYSAPNALAKLDGRTREARLMQQVRNELTEHVGGSPSATQRALIERAVNLSVRIAVMDQRFAETATQTEHDSRTYLAWSNTLTRTMRSLGLNGPSSPSVDLGSTPTKNHPTARGGGAQSPRSARAHVLTDENGNVLTAENGNAIECGQPSNRPVQHP
jgi:hypothetical protein